MSLKIEIHGVGNGTCAYSGKEDVPGVMVTFGDGFLNATFISEAVFKNFLKMRAPKLGAKPTAAAVPAATPAPKNGEAVR
jgi:hypothetical protein